MPRRSKLTVTRKAHTRKPHRRKAFRRRDGVKVKATTVKSTRVPKSTYKIRDLGTRGKQSRGAKAPAPHAKQRRWIRHKGKLGGPGYLQKPATARHAALRACVKSAGYRSCLGSVMVLERSKALRTKYGKKLAADRAYLKRTYGGPGSFGKRKTVRRRRTSSVRRHKVRRAA